MHPNDVRVGDEPPIDARVEAGGPDVDDEPVVLPWWRNPVNVVATAVAIATLSGALGWVIGNNTALADPNATDVGFLQDMRAHHEQAVQMSFAYLSDPGTDAGLRTVAGTIIVEQQLEVGRMIQLLRDFGESEVNETDIAMSWMDEPIALERMPGMATDDELQRLRDAEGADADRIFVDLMTAHHQGGIHMAEHAAEHSATSEVRTLAALIVAGQQEEIVEMRGLLAR